jgi:DNA-directed RNA polymerase subunit delta
MSQNAVSDIHPSMDVVDIVYQLLKKSREQTHYKELIRQAMDIKGQSTEGDEFQRKVAAILTQINLDIRFFHYGKGIWGLKEWSPKQKAPRVPLLAPLHKRQDDSIELNEDEEEEDIEKNFIIDDFDFDEEDDHEDYED